MCLLLIGESHAYSQAFLNEKLANIAKKIALSPLKGDSASSYIDAGVYGKKEIVAGVDKNDIVFHIGYKLFSNDLKSEHPHVVFDFVERYFLELMTDVPLTERAQHLHDDKVIFYKGTTNDILRVTPETPCVISFVDEKYYQVSWLNHETSFLTIAFPAQYELLLGMPKNEIEKKVSTQISSVSEWKYINSTPDSLQHIDGNVYMTKPCSNYYVESLNTAKYYTISAEGTPYPVFSVSDKWHSAANLFQGIIPETDGYKIYVQQNLYGFNTSTFIVSLSDWLSYCRENEMTVYFAIEEEYEDGLKALLIAQSKKLGFNHMLSIVLPEHFVDNPKTVFKAALNAYIPTQNIKNLYQQQTTGKRKKKI